VANRACRYRASEARSARLGLLALVESRRALVIPALWSRPGQTRPGRRPGYRLSAPVSIHNLCAPGRVGCGRGDPHLPPCGRGSQCATSVARPRPTTRTVRDHQMCRFTSESVQDVGGFGSESRPGESDPPPTRDADAPMQGDRLDVARNRREQCPVGRRPSGRHSTGASLAAPPRLNGGALLPTTSRTWGTAIVLPDIAGRRAARCRRCAPPPRDERRLRIHAR